MLKIAYKAKFTSHRDNGLILGWCDWDMQTFRTESKLKVVRCCVSKTGCYSTFTSFVNFKVCRDSSRVGDKISERMPAEEWALRRSNIGMRNAAVLPLPVLAIATTSLPSSNSGIVWKYPSLPTYKNFFSLAYGIPIMLVNQIKYDNII